MSSLHMSLGLQLTTRRWSEHRWWLSINKQSLHLSDPCFAHETLRPSLQQGICGELELMMISIRLLLLIWGARVQGSPLSDRIAPNCLIRSIIVSFAQHDSRAFCARFLIMSEYLTRRVGNWIQLKNWWLMTFGSFKKSRFNSIWQRWSPPTLYLCWTESHKSFTSPLATYSLEVCTRSVKQLSGCQESTIDSERTDGLWRR